MTNFFVFFRHPAWFINAGDPIKSSVYCFSKFASSMVQKSKVPFCKGTFLSVNVNLTVFEGQEKKMTWHGSIRLNRLYNFVIVGSENQLAAIFKKLTKTWFKIRDTITINLDYCGFPPCLPKIHDTVNNERCFVYTSATCVP